MGSRRTRILSLDSRRLDDAAIDAPGLVGTPVELVGRREHLGLRLRDRLALLGGEHGSHVVGTGTDQFGDPSDGGAARPWVGHSPHGQPGGRGLERCIEICL